MSRYTEHYSGPHRQAIFSMFEQFVQAMRTDDFSALGDLCTEDCSAVVSMVGRLEGVAAIARGLRWPGPMTTVSRATIWNFVARTDGERGIQTAYVQLVRAIEDGPHVHPFLWGLQFAGRLRFDGGRWRYEELRVDLCYEAGNDSFVRPAWSLMDYSAYAGHPPAISAEFDNPWRVVPVDAEPQTDTEQVFDLMFKYAYAFDNGDFEFLLSFVTEDFFINGAAVEKEHGVPPLDAGDLVGRREIVDFLKSKFHKEAKMMHSCRMGSIVIDGDTAVALMPRGEDHRLRNRILDTGTVHTVATTAVHKLVARRAEDGGWRLARYRIETTSSSTPVADDVVAFDEHVLGTSRAVAAR